MDLHAFLAAKRDRNSHSNEDIAEFCRMLISGAAEDYQVSAWLMAAYINGLEDRETAALARAMADSGQTIDLSALQKPVIDKHSTGGVGDAVTPLFLPIMAACGVTVVKMSGRGLGFTGGTLDKLSAIPNFRTDLSEAELIAIAKKVGCAWSGQTKELAPADKILYALRDATETVNNISLIAASIMSKKLASGADAIVLDVKWGSGAFAKTKDEAERLSQEMIAIGEHSGKRIAAVLSEMNQPLAPAIGNALEVKAAIAEIKSGCKSRLGSVTVELCRKALALAGKSADPMQVTQDGRALEKMKEWIAAQGGDARVVDDPSLLPAAAVTAAVKSESQGVVSAFDCEALGEIARALGAGRFRAEDEIDLGVGIELHVELGRRIAKGDLLFTIHARSAEDADVATRSVRTAIMIKADLC
jgi:pyrimidine-nucleoside phosphorylase